MTFEQLRIFVAVAECLHMTRAAETIGLTQSGTSAAIASLEGRYGVPLFNRVGRRIELTEAGREFLPRARSVLSAAAHAHACLLDLTNLRYGKLKICASQTISSHWLPGKLAHFHQKYPGIALDIMTGNTNQVAQAVLEGSVDLGFIEAENNEVALSSTVVGYDRIVLVAARTGEKIPQRLTRETLLNSRWVLREQGSGVRRAFENEVSKFGLTPDDLNVTFAFPTNGAVLTAVENGAGLTLTSSLAAKNRPNLISIDIGLEPRCFNVLRHKERYFTSAQKTLIGMIGSMANEELRLLERSNSNEYLGVA